MDLLKTAAEIMTCVLCRGFNARWQDGALCDDCQRAAVEMAERNALEDEE